MKHLFKLILLSIIWSDCAYAADLEKFVKSGYTVIYSTRVAGEFNGCDYGDLIPLEDGRVFECQTMRPHFAFFPQLLVLLDQETGDQRIIIDQDEFSGNLYEK